MQYENLNKGRVRGPWVTVDTVETDEGAIGAAGLLSFPTRISRITDLSLSVAKKSQSHHLCKRSVLQDGTMACLI